MALAHIIVNEVLTYIFVVLIPMCIYKYMHMCIIYIHSFDSMR